MTDITSFSNPLVKRIRSLKHKKYRRRENCFWAEGIRAVLEAIELNWDIEMLVWAPDMLCSDRARQMLDQTALRQTTVSTAVYHHLTVSELPQGLGALIRPPQRHLADYAPGTDRFFVVLEAPQDRGNVGAIVRTVDCAGGSGVILIGQAVDPYDPEALRASMGSIFSVPVFTSPTPSAFLTWAQTHDLWLVGTSARTDLNFRQATYRPPLALLFGNERAGLSTELQDAVNEFVHIPIQGRASSLNLGAAVAVMTYQVQLRHRLA